MRLPSSFKTVTPKKQFIFPLLVAVVVFLLVGLPEKVYSPAHIGHYAIPIPINIPVLQSSDSSTEQPSSKSSTVKNSLAATNSPVVFNHANIITTFFWVGEKASSDNGYIANSASAWDGRWQQHYGGEDAPSPRNGYNPFGFTPKENPFYFALPYNDIDAQGNRKTTANSCPLAGQKQPYSWCKNSWIAIRHNGKIAYAQWEDVGPFAEDDFIYVFGNAAPQNKQDAKAGLDVSPAVRDYLGLNDVDKCDWAFVAQNNIPSGPWSLIVTSSAGEAVNN